MPLVVEAPGTTIEPDLLRRYHAAVDLVRADPDMSADRRLELLYLVLAPTPDLLDASREAAQQKARPVKLCGGCGVPRDELTKGCGSCARRHCGRRRAAERAQEAAKAVA
jgi:hypothetical protein